MIVTERERQVLRELAKQVADIAALPVQAERIKLWKALNSLNPVRPMVLLNPQRGWRELVPSSELQCQDNGLREIERPLRMKIARHHVIHDDHPITDSFAVGWVIKNSGWGVDLTPIYAEDDTGGFRWDPPIKTYGNLAKLHPAEIEVDREATGRRLESLQELFGDILDVRQGGVGFCRVKLTRNLILLRGLEQFMVDMYDAPQFVHELMGFLREEMGRELEFYERENLFALNNGPENLAGSGGLAATDDLPSEDYDPDHVRMKDMFVWGESQESVGIGPEQFHEFVLQHQFSIINRFGLAD